jgi:hypothetical protein
MKKPAAILAAAFVFTCTIASTAQAITITSPLTLDSEGVLGTVRPGVPFGSTVVDDYTNYLLDLNLNTTTTFEGQTYIRDDTVDPGSGTVSSTDYITGTGTFVESGWEYVAAKYDGPNGGIVVFYVGGESLTLTQTSYDLWTNKKGQGYELSGWVAFNTWLPPTTIPDGGSTLTLLGSAVVIFAMLCRRVDKS